MIGAASTQAIDDYIHNDGQLPHVLSPLLCMQTHNHTYRGIGAVVDMIIMRASMIIATILVMSMALAVIISLHNYLPQTYATQVACGLQYDLSMGMARSS